MTTRSMSEVMAALQPFAAVAENDIGASEADEDKFVPARSHNLAPAITVGDMRRAAELLSSLQRNPEGDVVRDEELTLAKDAGADFVLHSLADALKLDGWTQQDGSETWEGDVHATLMHILRASVLNPETDEPLYLHPPRGQGTGGLRFAYANGTSLQAIRDEMEKSALYQLGDCRLVWVNEGDFWQLMPTDLSAAFSPKATKGDGDDA